MGNVMQPIKLLGKLPKGNADGLYTLYETLKAQRDGGYAVVYLGTEHVKQRAGLPSEPTAVILQIEGLATDELKREAERLMKRARRVRAQGEGAETLPPEVVDLGDADPDDGPFTDDDAPEAD